MSLRADEEWVRRRYSLNTSVSGSTLRLSGTISFRAHYTGNVLVYGDSIPVIVKPDKIIADSWPVIFIHNYQSNIPIPRVWDASDRLNRTQSRRKISSQDMHLNDRPVGSFCVAPKSALEKAFTNGFDLEHYFNYYLLPFLFQQSYFEKHCEWPWWNYPHGDSGEYLWKMEERVRRDGS